MGFWGRADRVALRSLLKKNWILFSACNGRMASVSLCLDIPARSPAVRSFIPNLFLFILIPAVLVFLIGITRYAAERPEKRRITCFTSRMYDMLVRLGLGAGLHIGVGSIERIDTSLAPFVNGSALLAWADETGGASPGFNASSVIASLPGLRQDAVVRVPRASDVANFCLSTSCFAGVVFSDPSSGSTRNYTLLFPAQAIPYGVNVETAGGFAAIGILQLQIALDQALVAQVRSRQCGSVGDTAKTASRTTLCRPFPASAPP